MEICAGLGALVCFHPENDDIVRRLSERLAAEGRSDPMAHADARPPVAETEAVGRALELGLATGCRTHLCHVSVERGFDLVAHALGDGADASGETCTHYLVLDEDDLRRQGGRAKINPPLRPRAQQDAALWRLLDAGRIDQVTSEPRGLGARAQGHAGHLRGALRRAGARDDAATPVQRRSGATGPGRWARCCRCCAPARRRASAWRRARGRSRRARMPTSSSSIRTSAGASTRPSSSARPAERCRPWARRDRADQAGTGARQHRLRRRRGARARRVGGRCAARSRRGGWLVAISADRNIKAQRGGELRCRGWRQESILRMLENNLENAERPRGADRVRGLREGGRATGRASTASSRR